VQHFTALTAAIFQSLCICIVRINIKFCTKVSFHLYCTRFNLCSLDANWRCIWPVWAHTVSNRSSSMDALAAVAVLWTLENMRSASTVVIGNVAKIRSKIIILLRQWHGTRWCIFFVVRYTEDCECLYDYVCTCRLVCKYLLQIIILYFYLRKLQKNLECWDSLRLAPRDHTKLIT